MRYTFITVMAFAYFVLVSSCTEGVATSPESAIEIRTAADHIDRIERGLLPAVVVSGETPQTFTLTEMMQRLSVPGVSIAVVKNGRLDWAKGYGVVSPGKEQVTEETLFQAGSISKPVAALLVLSEVHSGIIDLDTDINSYLKSWKVPENEFTKVQPVTLRYLLNHTSGIPDFEESDYDLKTGIPTLVQLLKGEPPARNEAVNVQSIPGNIFEYSSAGYAVLQLVLEDVAGKPFYQIMQERVLEPLSMKHSFFLQPLSPDLSAKAASGHIGSGQPIEDLALIYPDLAAGGLWTTPSDYAQIIMELEACLAGKSKIGISREMGKRMYTADENGMALGFAPTGEGVKMRVGHSGSTAGFKCQFVAFPRTGNGVVVMANSNTSVPLVEAVILAVAKEYGWPGIEPREIERFILSHKELEAYAGEYRIGDYAVNISIDGDNLRITHFEGEDLLLPASETQFYQQLDGIELTFEKNDAGDVEAISLFGGRLRLIKSEREQH